MTASERFAQLIRLPEDDIPLDEAALLIAAHGCAGLDVAAELAALDELASRCPERSLDGLRRYLFDDLGFGGNAGEYTDPRNSFLNEVVARRTGIPITLSVLTMEVGRRLGVDLGGVGMPGHFLVRHRGEPSVFIDSFRGGEVLDEAGCEQRFREVMGKEVAFRPDYLETVGTRAILQRMLANLDRVYRARGQLDQLAWVMGLQLTFPATPRAN